MADTSLLKKLYADESDEQLIDKVLNKKNGLTDEALTIAKEELLRRNINLHELEIAQQNAIERKKNYEKFKAEKSELELKELTDLVMAEKLKGTTDAEVLTILEKKGVSRDISTLLFKDVKEECKNYIDSIWSDLFYGGVGAFIGIGLAIWIFRVTEGGRLFITLGLIIAGLYKFFRGITNLLTYKAAKKVVRGFD